MAAVDRDHASRSTGGSANTEIWKICTKQTTQPTKKVVDDDDDYRRHQIRRRDVYDQKPHRSAGNDDLSDCI